MTAPTLTDTQRRFLAAVVQRLPRERVQEVYLFSPMKQGGIETGIAVIASAEHDPPAEATVEEVSESSMEAPAGEDHPGADHSGEDHPVDAAVAGDTGTDEGADEPASADVPLPGPGDGAVRAAEASDPTEAAARDEVPPEEAADDPATAVVGESSDGADACVVVGEAVASALDAGDAAGAVEALAIEEPTDLSDGESPADQGSDEGDDAGPLAPPPPPRPSRFTIFTARYRLQLKGPERGKWEVDVVEEADAPLVTVDAVIRGVQRRAGELSAVERLSAADFATVLDEAPWASR